jgi:hypothetical protein
VTVAKQTSETGQVPWQERNALDQRNEFITAWLPIRYVLHMGQHFVPLRLKTSQVQPTFQSSIFTTFKKG